MRLYGAILKRALADLTALLSGNASIPGDTLVDPDSGRPMNEAERLRLLEQTLDWFINEDDDSPCSLNETCHVLGRDASKLRADARALAHGLIPQPRLKRPKLTRAVRTYVLDSLSRGATTGELARELAINPATVRKIRIRHRALAARGTKPHTAAPAITAPEAIRVVAVQVRAARG